MALHLEGNGEMTVAADLHELLSELSVSTARRTAKRVRH